MGCTGVTTISAGTLRVGAESGTNTTTSLATSSSIVNNATLIFRRTDAAEVDVEGFTQNADVWIKPDGANVWTFRESSGVLTYTAASAFNSWIDTPAFGLTAGKKGATADPENDGIENLLEYVLNGNPGSSNPAILPTLNTSANNFVFSFTRRMQSASDTTRAFQYGSALGGWTSPNITPPTKAAVTLAPPD